MTRHYPQQFWISNSLEKVAEELQQKLGREPSGEEINSYIEEFEARNYDSKEAELKGN